MSCWLAQAQRERERERERECVWNFGGKEKCVCVGGGGGLCLTLCLFRSKIFSNVKYFIENIFILSCLTAYKENHFQVLFDVKCEHLSIHNSLYP